MVAGVHGYSLAHVSRRCGRPVALDPAAARGADLALSTSVLGGSRFGHTHVGRRRRRGVGRNVWRLADGDYALLRFEGEDEPRRVGCLLISAADQPADQAAVGRFLTAGGVAEQSIRLVSVDDLSEVWAAFPAPWPPLDFLVDERAKEELVFTSDTVLPRRRRPRQAAIDAFPAGSTTDGITVDLGVLGTAGDEVRLMADRQGAAT